jgi:hypothetical protein
MCWGGLDLVALCCVGVAGAVLLLYWCCGGGGRIGLEVRGCEM